MVDDHLREVSRLLDEIPPSREVSLVKTKVDEARMWLEKAERTSRETKQPNPASRR
jgi:hypothetical protein